MRRSRSELLLDLIIPVGSVLVIWFALGSIYYEGHFRMAGGRSHEIIKSYVRSAAALQPY